MAHEDVIFAFHAYLRMRQHGISEEAVFEVLQSGTTIKWYPEDRPFPSRLILGYWEGQPVHVVAADDAVHSRTVVITVYGPEPGLWEQGFSKRRRT